MEAPPILSLPTEILYDILRILHPIYITRCRAVCTQIRDSIDYSSELRRLIELGLKGYQPNRHFDGCWSEEIHERFLDSQRRLFTMNPVSTETHELNFGSVVYDDGLRGCDLVPLFMAPGNSGSTTLIDLMPRHSHSVTSSGTWSQEYGTSTGTRIGYGLSAREGLMVVVYLHESTQGVEIEVQFKSFSPTDHSVVPHPRIIGTAGITTRLAHTTVGLPRAKVHICGDDVVIGISLDDGTEKTLWIICWVSGTTLLMMDGIYDARFLGPGKVLVVSPSQAKTHIHLSLLRLLETQEPLHFELPIPISGINYCDLIVSPAARYNAASKGPFERQSLPWEFDCDLEICAMEIRTGRYPEDIAFLIVIRVQLFDTFRPLGDLGRDSIPWNEWGPQSTRWFKIPDWYSGISIYGSQLYWELPLSGLEEFVGDSPPARPLAGNNVSRTNAILDFNSQNTILTVGSDPQSTQGRLFRDTWTHNNRPLTCVVTCSLPFVMHAIPSADWAKPMAHEGSYIVDIVRTGTQHILRVQSFISPL